MGPEHHHHNEIAEAIQGLTQAVREFAKDQQHQEILHKLELFVRESRAALSDTLIKLQQTEDRIMSAFTDFAAKQKQYNERMGTAIDGVKTDVEALLAKIQELQDSAGEVTPEDQALLDELQTAGEALVARLEQVDEMNPPVIPPQP